GDTLDHAVLEIELPEAPAFLSTDEELHVSMGVGLFDITAFCWVGTLCPTKGMNGSWQALQIRDDGSTRELQLALAMKDSLTGTVYPHAIGVYLDPAEQLRAGERVQLRYVGYVPGRATAWTGRPFITHFRYRSF